uniref:Putative AraC family transcription regulator n=1 Tax=Alloalcanivorax dieselolei TaxID=285091 RepID=D2JNX7_9GAMM|nr:putative AraC family transcription regulator [Alloalcanivorax dieselolei]
MLNERNLTQDLSPASNLMTASWLLIRLPGRSFIDTLGSFKDRHAYQRTVSMTQQKGEPKASEGGIPSNYSRLIARELDLTVSQLPSLLQGTGRPGKPALFRWLCRRLVLHHRRR